MLRKPICIDTIVKYIENPIGIDTLVKYMRNPIGIATMVTYIEKPKRYRYNGKICWENQSV